MDGPSTTPEIHEIRDVQSRVRAAARSQGWVWAALAPPSALFVIAGGSDVLPRAAAFWLVVAFGAAAGVLVLAEQRRRVVGREASRLDEPVTVVYAGTLLGAFALAGLASGRWPVVAGLALLPCVPCLWAALRILRA